MPALHRNKTLCHPIFAVSGASAAIVGQNCTWCIFRRTVWPIHHYFSTRWQFWLQMILSLPHFITTFRQSIC